MLKHKICTLQENMLVTDYIKKHRQIRQEMILAKFPNIANEQITVNYIIKGLATHSGYATLIPALQVAQPRTVNAVSTSLELCKSLRLPRQSCSIRFSSVSNPESLENGAHITNPTHTTLRSVSRSRNARRKRRSEHATPNRPRPRKSRASNAEQTKSILHSPRIQALQMIPVTK